MLTQSQPCYLVPRRLTAQSRFSGRETISTSAPQLTAWRGSGARRVCAPCASGSCDALRCSIASEFSEGHKLGRHHWGVLGSSCSYLFHRSVWVGARTPNKCRPYLCRPHLCSSKYCSPAEPRRAQGQFSGRAAHCMGIQPSGP